MVLEKFLVGDVVMLRSGGPEMVVKKIKHEECGSCLIYCEWFVKYEMVMGYDFAPETIDLVRRKD
jgi:uncharacterized protein YodC (DUF2158 family)